MPKNKKNILVFPCGSEIGLDIYNSVRYSTYFHLIGGSSIDDHGKFVYEDYIPNLPFATSPDFIQVLARLVIEYQIDAIYPAMDMVITILKEHEQDLGCKVVASPLETTKICLSKERTYHILKKYVHTPKVYKSFTLMPHDFPVFAKPIIGYGAKGTKLLNSQTEVDDFVANKKDILIVEYLPGEEYTVDCFTNKSGDLLYCAARTRNRIKDGISVNTSFVECQEEFLQIANIINSHIKFRGAWFYQVKRDKKGVLCLLEIASRIAGSSLLTKAIGVNLALLSLFDIFDYNVSVMQGDYYVELDRALSCKYRTTLEYDSVYCDYDDCLILNKNEINIELVKFLYQCVNQGKKIYLLSKHEGDLMGELYKFRLLHLFDQVIQIDKDSDKAHYIISKNAIFIDDSNNERMNINTQLHIPVFSPEMIDVLLQ